MKLKFNAPTTLVFALAATVVQLSTMYVFPGLAEAWFSAPPAGHFQWNDLGDYFRLFSHVIGHDPSSWDHLLGNFMFILMLGPMLEEKYGSQLLLVMLIVTALVTGILNALFFSTALMGASGVVFMMILLGSFTNIKAGEIPLTFFVIVTLYLFKEVFNAFQENDISEFAHILGGIMGSVFGFVTVRLAQPPAAPAS